MFGNSLVVLVLIAVMVHSYVPYDSKEPVAPFDDTDDKLVDNLKQLIQKSIKVEKEALHKLHKEVSKKIKEALKQNKYKFHKQLHESLEQIKNLKEEAQKQRVNINLCLKGEEELRHLPKEFYKGVAACDKDILSKSKALAAREKKTVEESLHVVNKLSAELKACEISQQVLKCKSKVAVEITQAVVQEPAKITEIIREAVPALFRLVPFVVTCSNKEARKFMIQGERIAKGIETCISEKLRPHLEI